MNAPDTHWTVAINKKIAKRSFWSLLVLLILYLIAAPMYCGYTDKYKVSEILQVMLTTSKVQVQDIIESTPVGHLPDFSKLESPIQIGRYGKMNTVSGEPVYIEHYQVNQRGQIMLIASGLNIFLELSPLIEKGKVKSWQCYGRPIKIMPVICRTEKTHTQALKEQPSAAGTPQSGAP